VLNAIVDIDTLAIILGQNTDIDMIILNLDTLAPDGKFGFVDNSKKVERIIELIPNLKAKIDSIPIADKRVITIATDIDRYILVYQKDFQAATSIIYIIDCDLDLDSNSAIQEYNPFSEKLKNQIKQFQKEIRINISELSLIYLTDADIDELPTNFNGIYSCNIDSVVIKKAKELGIIYAIENVMSGEGRRTAIVDECVVDELDNKIVNIYCIIHWDNQIDKKDNGYMYIKWRDLMNNLDKMELFEKALKPLIGGIDKAILLEKIDKYRMN
jgi:hypothetical protein